MDAQPPIVRSSAAAERPQADAEMAEFKPPVVPSSSNVSGVTNGGIPFTGGFIKDEMAKRMDPFQPDETFLWTGKKPAVGQRAETQVNFHSGVWCRLSGIVTEVGDLPLLSEWLKGGTYCITPDGRCSCCDAQFDEFPRCKKEDRYMAELEGYGTLHGQTLTSYAVLNFDFHGKKGLKVKDDRVYRVTHRADDHLENFWVAELIEDVGHIDDEDYPQPFMDWKERLKTLGVGLDGSPV